VVADRGGLPLRFDAVSGELKARLSADAVHDSAREAPLPARRSVAVGLDELKLERRAAAVEDKDPHPAFAPRGSMSIIHVKIHQWDQNVERVRNDVGEAFLRR
jgi:hypothetical protein